MHRRVLHIVKTGVLVATVIHPAAGRAAEAHFDAPYLGADIDGRPVTAAVGDFDRDGVPDLAVTNSGREVSILIGLGTGLFEPHVEYPVSPPNTANASTGVACADLNADGILDLVVTTPTRNAVTLLFGNGNGTFGPGTDLVTAEYPGQAAIADLNGDGIPDLALPCWYGRAVSLLVSVAPGVYTSGGTIATSDGCSAVGAGDLNGDGHADLAYSAGDVVHWVSGDGQGHFGSATMLEDTGVYVYTIAIGDADGDGHEDLAWCGASGVTVQLGDGLGGFSRRGPFNPTASVSDFELADLDGDGVRDLVTANQGSASFLAGLGDGLYGAPRHFVTDSANRDVAVADLNLDGRLDAVLCPYNSSSISILFGDGRGRLGGGRVLDMGFAPAQLALADFDFDGELDLVASDTDVDRVVILRGDGEGGFAFWTAVGMPERVDKVVVADLNHDFLPDILALSRTDYYAPQPGTLYILLCNGLGTFAPPQSYACDVGLADVAVADFSQDGIRDVAILNVGADSQYGQDPGGVDIRLGTGGGHLGAAFRLVDTPHPMSMSTADLNGDGRMDLAVGYASAIRFYFPPSIQWGGIGTPAPVRSLVLAEMTGDAWVDIGALVGTTPTLQPASGYGNFFGHGIALPSTTWDVRVLAGDLNGDGKAELLSQRDTGHTIAAFTAIGQGGYFSQLVIGTGEGSGVPVIGDVTSDGRPDLVVPTRSSSYGIVPNGLLVIANQPLPFVPVKLFDFEASARASGVELRWTAITDGPAVFQVLRAPGEASTFEAVGPAVPAVLGRHLYRCVDVTAAADRTYGYRIGWQENDTWRFSHTIEVRTHPAALALDPPRVDAVGRQVDFGYVVPDGSAVRLGLFDVAGRRVRELGCEAKDANRGHAIWDGTSEAGAPVASGIYYAKLEWRGQTVTRTVLWVR